MGSWMTHDLTSVLVRDPTASVWRAVRSAVPAQSIVDSQSQNNITYQTRRTRFSSLSILASSHTTLEDGLHTVTEPAAQLPRERLCGI